MEVPEGLRARANRPSPPPLEQVRTFLRGHVADAESLDEVRADLASLAEVNAGTVRRIAEAITALLADPPPAGVLATLVAWDGNWVLEDDTSDALAARWLGDLSDLVRGAAGG
jgi:hypothetical protein